MAQLKAKTTSSTNVPAKLFRNGGSQAVRLPAAFRFDGDTVYASRDEVTGNVTLSQKLRGKSWDEIFAQFDAADIPDDFLVDRPLNAPITPRNVFADEIEEERNESGDSAT